MEIEKKTAVSLLLRVSPITAVVNLVSFWAFVYILISTILRGTFLWKGATLLIVLILVRSIVLLPVRWFAQRNFDHPPPDQPNK